MTASIQIGLKGDKALTKALQSMSAEIEQEVSKAVVGSALELRGEIIKAIQSGPATGRIYEKYNPRRTHQASAAGQAPMSDTGGLAGSVYFEQVDPLTAAVASNSLVALWLEFRTRNMAARPVWQPAALEAEEPFRKRVEKAVRVATK